MNYEAGFCVFAFIVFCCVLVYALYRRALKVEHSQQLDSDDVLLSRDDVLELAARVDTDSLESGNSKIPPRPFSPVPERVRSVPKGWQPWEGGDCPVSWAQDVVIMRRNGSIESTYGGGETWWHAEIFSGQYDILAYRIAD